MNFYDMSFGGACGEYERFCDGGASRAIDSLYPDRGTGRNQHRVPDACGATRDNDAARRLRGGARWLWAGLQDRSVREGDHRSLLRRPSRPFSATFQPPGAMGQTRDAEGARFWEKSLTDIAVLDALEGRHNRSPVTEYDGQVLPSRSLPSGAAACVRNDWAGTVKPNATWRSREYICVRWIAAADAYQQVEIEVVEIRSPGAAAAPIDFRQTADTIFASLRFRQA